MDERSVQWRRRVGEAVTITLSILVAFAIDAWWERAQEAASDRDHMESVLRELQTTANLLDDAIRLHRLSQEQALNVLELTSSGAREAVQVDSLDSLLFGLWSSYQINPPTGALEAAVLSGTVARLEDATLRDQLLGWDSLLEDLLEEEDNGFRNATSFLREFLPDRMSMRGPVSAYRESVSGEAVGERQEDLPATRYPSDLAELLRDRGFENQILLLWAFARASEDEARAFRMVVDDTMQRIGRAL